MVTGQIFNQILNRTKRNAVYQGFPGMGKTSSAMLLSILTNIIVEYKLKNFGKAPSDLS